VVGEWSENNVILGEIVEIVIFNLRKEDSVVRKLSLSIWDKECDLKRNLTMGKDYTFLSPKNIEEKFAEQHIFISE